MLIIAITIILLLLAVIWGLAERYQEGYCDGYNAGQDSQWRADQKHLKHEAPGAKPLVPPLNWRLR